MLGNREVPIPEHLDIFFLKREMAPSDKTALECVMEVDATRLYLEAEAEELALKGDDECEYFLLYDNVLTVRFMETLARFSFV